jgi:hypothetical protein
VKRLLIILFSFFPLDQNMSTYNNPCLAEDAKNFAVGAGIEDDRLAVGRGSFGTFIGITSG